MVSTTPADETAGALATASILRVEATTGFEPVIGVLQTLALPLGYVAGWTRETGAEDGI